MSSSIFPCEHVRHRGHCQPPQMLPRARSPCKADSQYVFSLAHPWASSLLKQEAKAGTSPSPSLMEKSEWSQKGLLRFRNNMFLQKSNNMFGWWKHKKMSYKYSKKKKKIKFKTPHFSASPSTWVVHCLLTTSYCVVSNCERLKLKTGNIRLSSPERFCQSWDKQPCKTIAKCYV